MVIEERAFYDARYRVLGERTDALHGGGGIGTLSEKSLHSIIKYTLEPREEKHEIPLLGSYCDIYNEEGIFEVQTRSLYRLRSKLDKFLPEYRVNVVYPVARTRALYWVDPETGAITPGRKTTSHGGALDAARELSGISSYLAREGLLVHLVFLNIEEYRFLDGFGKDKKKRSTRIERIPASIDSVLTLSCARDYAAALMPAALRDAPFTQKAYEKAIKHKGRTAYGALRILLAIGIIRRVGKEGRAFLYEYTKEK